MSFCSKCGGFYYQHQMEGTVCVFCSISDRLYPVAPDGDGNKNSQRGQETIPDGFTEEQTQPDEP